MFFSRQKQNLSLSDFFSQQKKRHWLRWFCLFAVLLAAFIILFVSLVFSLPFKMVKNILPLSPTSQSAFSLLNNLPEMLGKDGEKNYLVVFENNMEMRATGGFIGSYGVVTVKGGKIEKIFTDDVYNLDKLAEGKLVVAAPWPIQRYNQQKYWYLRDANWSPDWPTSAKQIIWFFNRERQVAGFDEQKIDAVIAITPDVVADLLGIFGPIKIQGIEFNHDNFATALERFVEFEYYQRGLKKDERKDIIGELAQELVGRVSDFSIKQMFNLWLVFKNNIDSKQILVYFFDPELEQIFADNNWSGEVRQCGDDYLLVIDSNLAALKTDSVMKKSIDYQVKTDANGDLAAKLAVTYQHQGNYIKDLISGYRDYVRVYVPESSYFLKAYFKEGEKIKELKILTDVEVGSELGKKYVGVFLTVEPGQSKTLVLEYHLPESVKKSYQEGLYKFCVQKQAGTVGHNLKINLNFNKRIDAYSASVSPANFSGKTIEWQTDLAVDREFGVKF